jgi:hypothetical protein
MGPVDCEEGDAVPVRVFDLAGISTTDQDTALATPGTTYNCGNVGFDSGFDDYLDSGWHESLESLRRVGPARIGWPKDLGRLGEQRAKLSADLGGRDSGSCRQTETVGAAGHCNRRDGGMQDSEGARGEGWETHCHGDC